MQMASLLRHSPHLPVAARDALAEAHRSAPEKKTELLMFAARILHRELGVECADALELVDLRCSV